MYRGKYINNSSPESSPPKKKSIKIGTILFYLIYLAIFPVFFYYLHFAMTSLEDWLIRYEASPPNVKCQEVYEALFSDPDWVELYKLANIEDTKFENVDHFAAYMEDRIDPAKLTYNETSAGLSGNHKYIVKQDQEKIAVFTLTSQNEPTSEIQDWKLDSLELFFQPTRSVTVTVQAGRVVTLNDVLLGDEYIVQKTTTAAEDYLPEGLHGARTETYYVSDLLTAPNIQVKDADGASVTMSFDAASATYTEPAPVYTIGDLESRVKDTAEVYCKYMIRAIGRDTLKHYFDKNSPIHDNIYYNETWMQSYQSYEMGEITISEYVPYAEDLFSARATLSMFVTRWDDSVKEYKLDTTFFFRRFDSQWLAIDMTNVDIQKVSTQVRLLFRNLDTLIESRFVEKDVTQLTLPQITAPSGKIFTGWFQKTRDNTGDITYTLVFQPDENGQVFVSDEMELVPMELYAMFQPGGLE